MIQVSFIVDKCGYRVSSLGALAQTTTNLMLLKQKMLLCNSAYIPYISPSPIITTFPQTP